MYRSIEMNTSERFTHNVYKYIAVILVLSGMAFLLYKPVPGHATGGNPVITSHPAEQARIQLAILLDTSNSMDGLIDQAKNQLWQVVNEFARSKKNGMSPVLEVAVYEYGNSNLTAGNGYIRQVTGLTRNLDVVSEALFSLTTNGGDEYCGYVIDRAVNELTWNDSTEDIKVIFIAGNEPFNQGPVAYRQAVKLAKQKGITVNTIHAGNFDDGVRGGWQDGALLAGGNYMSIDHNHQVVHVPAPQDERITALNNQLNQTYIPYGSKGREGSHRQQAMDDKNKSVSKALMAERVRTKASALYDSSDWDLVDAIKNGTAALDSLAPEKLPVEMQKMNEKEQKDYVTTKKDERERIKQEIETLSREREAFIKESKSLQAESEPATVNTALSAAIHKEMEAKDFELENN